ncbi:MAG: PGPGW domain-containing protein [Candidatus Hydrogenedentes bacterium]|nr:PGPGW domain-containing protein [Candidatus Hydrogenedentota bacterium]
MKVSFNYIRGKGFRHMDPIKHARRLAVTVIGSTVLLVGLALLVLPGPAFVVIPIGLAILSTEFVWAARLLKHVKENAAYAAQTVIGSGKNSGASSYWSRLIAWLRPARTAPNE